jgi:hypothetical protein
MTAGSPEVLAACAAATRFSNSAFASGTSDSRFFATERGAPGACAPSASPKYNVAPTGSASQSKIEHASFAIARQSIDKCGEERFTEIRIADIQCQN